MSVETELLSLLERHGGLRPGLTSFRNGLYSDGWLEKGSLFAQPEQLEQVASWQAGSIAGAFPEATLIVGIPACGAVLASFVARRLGLPVAYVLLQPSPLWHRMNVPRPPQRIVYVDDLICTGRDTRTALKFLRESGHTVEGVSAWISRVPLEDARLVTLAQPPYRLLEMGELPRDPEFVYRDIRE